MTDQHSTNGSPDPASYRILRTHTQRPLSNDETGSTSYSEDEDDDAQAYRRPRTSRNPANPSIQPNRVQFRQSTGERQNTYSHDAQAQSGYRFTPQRGTFDHVPRQDNAGYYGHRPGPISSSMSEFADDHGMVHMPGPYGGSYGASYCTYPMHLNPYPHRALPPPAPAMSQRHFQNPGPRAYPMTPLLNNGGTQYSPAPTMYPSQPFTPLQHPERPETTHGRRSRKLRRPTSPLSDVESESDETDLEELKELWQEARKLRASLQKQKGRRAAKTEKIRREDERQNRARPQKKVVVVKSRSKETLKKKDMGVLMDKIERLSQQIQSLEQKGHDPRLGTDKEWVKSLTLSSRTQIDSHTALITKESKEPGLGGVLEDLNRTMQTINLTMAQIRSQDYRRYIDSKPRHDTAEFLGPEPRTRRSRRSTIGYREGGELDWEELQYSNKPPGVRRQVRASGPVSAFHDSEEEEGEQSVEQDYEEPTPSWEPIKTRQTQRQSEGTGAKGRRLAPLSTGGVKRAAAPNATSEARWRGGGRVQDGFETRNVDEQESDASNDSENMVAERSRREYRNAHRYRNSRERLNDTPPVPDAPRRAAKTGGVGKRGGRGQE